MKQLLLTILFSFSLSIYSQPQSPEIPPICNTSNPPPECDNFKPVPIDDFLSILLILAVGYGSYITYKNHKKLKKC